MIDLIRNFKKIEFKTQIKYESKFYLIKDANINKTKKLYKNFNKDLASYMIDKEKPESLSYNKTRFYKNMNTVMYHYVRPQVKRMEIFIT